MTEVKVTTGSTTRLDRLFTLLATSSTETSRSLAARQLASVVRGHPGQLHVLLTKLHPLLRSPTWDARVAAVQALSAIVVEIPDVTVKTEEEATMVEAPPMKDKWTFATFDLAEVMREARGTMVDEVEENTQVDLEKQKEALNRNLGLDVAAKLGVDTSDIFTSDDILASTSCMSSREKNQLKRTLSKQKSLKEAESKRRKLAPKLYQEESSWDPHVDGTWPLERFCTFLLSDLKEKDWEIRHGAASALRDIVKLQGYQAGKMRGLTTEQNVERQSMWLEDVSLRLLALIATDRFGDFVSDQVVAPVRESAGQALGSVLKLMEKKMVLEVAKVLLQLLKEEEWQCRHGSLLSVKRK